MARIKLGIAIVALTVCIFLTSIAFLEVLPIVFGAIISAFIGIISVYFGGKIREQEWKKENVYRPLYNEIDEIATSSGYVLKEEFTTRWKEIDSYSKLKIDEELRTGINQYESELDELKKILKEHENTREKHFSIFEDAVKKALQNRLTDDGKSIILERDANGHIRSCIEIKKWISLFGEVLFSCKSGAQLYEELVKYSVERRDGHVRFFKEWYTKSPEIFDNLAYEITNITFPQELKKITKKLGESRSKIVGNARELKGKLEKEITKIW